MGISDLVLQWFLAHPSPPDVIGLNYYLTSERFLDERLEYYPARTHGGNGLDAYADVEAVRVAADGIAGPASLLREAWARYHVPLAITEAHLGGTREEQVRWLAQEWQMAQQARGEGVDVRAVTPWALFGSFDWNTLVTCDAGYYEPGAFDLRCDPPRPTALAGLIRELATGQAASHPVLATPGWWQRPVRRLYPAISLGNRPLDRSSTETVRPLLLIGELGTVEVELLRRCALRGLPWVGLVGATNPAEIARGLRRWQPWGIVSCADLPDEVLREAGFQGAHLTIAPDLLFGASPQQIHLHFLQSEWASEYEQALECATWTQLADHLLDALLDGWPHASIACQPVRIRVLAGNQN